MELLEDFNARFLDLSINISFNDDALRSIYVQAIQPETLEKLYDQVKSEPKHEAINNLKTQKNLVTSWVHIVQLNRNSSFLSY